MEVSIALRGPITSPATPVGKRRSKTEEPRDEEENAHNRGKRRRIGEDAGRVCAGVKEASSSRAASPTEKIRTSCLDVSGPVSPSPDCVPGSAKHHISRTSTSRPPTPKSLITSSVEDAENVIHSGLTSESNKNPRNRRDKI
ncbi:hypothetical protein LY76DRAFT_595922 [Colletotrichum caudatum]|nr:hypothetical protein LY76DRAFT_595922 [Colletotrichum caudatum]